MSGPSGVSSHSEDADVITELPDIAWANNETRNSKERQMGDHQMQPPSFAQSEFEMITRRQKNSAHGLKIIDIPSRFPNLDNDWEFVGWGSMSYLELTPQDVRAAAIVMDYRPTVIGQLKASSIAGNGVIGSVFYAFPAVAAAAGIFSPLSLLIACLILFLYKPILLELGAAIRLNGGSYTYLLQFSGKTLSIIGAAATLLDAASTSTVSAATAVAYLNGEIADMPVPASALSLVLLAAFAFVALLSVREGTSVTLSFTLLHMATMCVLMGFSIASCIQKGPSIIIENWAERPRGAGPLLHAIFNGICIAFLGVTGFECTPAYIEIIASKQYPNVLRNMLFAALFLNAPLMLLVYAQVPSAEILSGANVLSLLAERVAGKWLRYILVADALTVLSGGIVAGLFTACGLLETLSQDGLLPALFRYRLPFTGGLLGSVMFFFATCIILLATSAFNLQVMSGVFSVTFLVVMLLYVVSNFMLKFNRDRMPREYRASLLTIISAFVLTLIVLIGNIVLAPRVLGLFASYFIVVLLCLVVIRSQARLARFAIWLYDQTPMLHGFSCTKGLDKSIVRAFRYSRRQPICVWVKGDQIYHLLEAILYVRRNESTARIVFVHAYQAIEGIPSELAPNVKILDEAFPSITLDLVFVQGQFTPHLVQAASQRLEIPRTNYKGVRVIHH